MVMQGVLMFIAEHKRIKNVSFIKKVLICLTWPIFSFLTVPIAVIAMFSRNVVWKTIPHTDTTNFEQLNDNQEKMTLLRNKLEEMEQETMDSEKESA